MGLKTSKESLQPSEIRELQDEGNVDFSSEEIKEWHREYRKSLKSGKKELTKEEFKKVYNSLFAGDASDFAENVFRTFDLDQDGKVDFKEFITGLSESGSSKLQRKLRWAFRMYDINGTGYITWEEMRHIIAAIFKMTDSVFSQELSTPDKLTDKIFHEFDIDRDGVLGYNEFCEGVARDPFLLHLLECDPDGSE